MKFSIFFRAFGVAVAKEDLLETILPTGKNWLNEEKRSRYYTQVATVETDFHIDIFYIMQNADMPWPLKDEVTVIGRLPASYARSMMTGDVIVSERGTTWLVTGDGYECIQDEPACIIDSYDPEYDGDDWNPEQETRNEIGRIYEALSQRIVAEVHKCLKKNRRHSRRKEMLDLVEEASDYLSYDYEHLLIVAKKVSYMIKEEQGSCLITLEAMLECNNLIAEAQSFGGETMYIKISKWGRSKYHCLWTTNPKAKGNIKNPDCKLIIADSFDDLYDRMGDIGIKLEQIKITEWNEVYPF